jgi:hypothetical protein
MQKVIDEKKYLYSFIMYYRGGTYISQVISSDVRSALFLWAKELSVKNTKCLLIHVKKQAHILFKD